MTHSCSESNAIGVEVRGIYDGILYWICKECGGAFHRFDYDDYRYERAKDFVNRHNQGDFL